MNTVKFGSAVLGVGAPPAIVAEIGINHNGDISLAREMIAAAAQSGAAAVKLQAYRTEAFLTPQSKYTDLFHRCELDRDAIIELATFAADHGILLFATPLDIPSAQMLAQIQMSVIKIASCDVTNIPLLRCVARSGATIVLSTGMASLSEVSVAYDTILNQGNCQIVLLHCIANYPARIDQINLHTIPYLAEVFDCPVGFSDHTTGTTAALLALGSGASMIEKHFTLDRNLPGPDHQLSALPQELTLLCQTAAQIPAIMGSRGKIPPEDPAHIIEMRRSIVAQCDINAGGTITDQMLACKRPGSGIPANLWDCVVGRTAACDIARDTVLELSMLK